MLTPRLVVFDMAGTTVEDPGAVNRCFREALATAGLVADPKAVDAVMGLPKPEAVRILIRDSGRAADLLPKADAIHGEFVARMLAYYEQDPSIREVRGIRPVFEALKFAGIAVGIDTGFNRAVADAILRRLGWPDSGLIAATVASDEVERGRPHPDMIRALMAAVGVDDPALVAKVGDAPADLEEGRNAGCGRIIGVTWGTHTREGLAAYPYARLVDEPGELLHALGLG